MSTSYYCFIIYLLLAFNSPSVLAQVSQKIIPVPKYSKFRTGNLTFEASVNISFIDDPYSRTLPAAEVINDAFKEHLQIITALEFEPTESQVLLRLLPELEGQKRMKTFNIPEDKKKEAYVIGVFEEKVVIEGFSPQGVFYGAITLAQIIATEKSRTIRQQVIVDWPDQAMRAVSQDISHGQVPTQATFREIINNLARNKFNTYFLYLEDAITFKNFTAIGEGRDRLSKSDISEIVSFAKKYYVDIIPVFETLGHHENILRLKQFESIQEFRGSSSLCVDCDFTYDYLKLVLKELSEYFPSDYIHIGGSESVDAGYGESQALAQSLGGRGALQVQHYQKVYEICNQLGKKVVMYDDMYELYPEASQNLAEDILVLGRPLSSGQGQLNLGPAALEPESFIPNLSLESEYSIFPANFIYRPKLEKLSSLSDSLKEAGVLLSHRGRLGTETAHTLLFYNYSLAAPIVWGGEQVSIDTSAQYFFRNQFGDNASMIEKAYQILGSSENAVLWSEFWQHPLLALRSRPRWIPKQEAIAFADIVRENTDSLILELRKSEIEILEADSILGRQDPQLKYIELLLLQARLVNYYGLKLETQIRFKNFMDTQRGDVNVLSGLADKNIRELEILRDDFERVWQYFYREKGLEKNLFKFDRLIQFFRESQEDLITFSLEDPLIISKWVYSCKPSGGRIKCDSQATFRKNIVLDSPPRIALLQFTGDSYAEVYINGQYITKANNRVSGSLDIENERIVFLNIKDYIREGNNEIVFRVWNNRRNLESDAEGQESNAGVNARGFIRTETTSFEIKTDESWTVKEVRNGRNFWIPVKVKPYPIRIIRPNFLQERVSNFEDTAYNE